MSRDVAHDGAGAFRVRFPFDRRLVELLKSLPRRRWHAVDKVWVVPETDVVPLVELLQPEGFTFDDEAHRRYADSGGTKAVKTAAASSEHWTVGRLNREVKAALAAAFPQSIWLAGEISGFNRSRHKKHIGFTLIERDAAGEQAYQVQAILFDGVRQEIERKLLAAGGPFQLEDELEVRVRARIDLYDAWGAYRVQIEDLDLTFTLGEAARRREEIVRKLAEAGLLERNAALPLPSLPLRLGLITSLGSDAYHDVLRTLGESGFAFAVTVHGARVQGRATESSVLNALDWFRARSSHYDVILICRGGGSRTDLQWFDTEALGRAVALFPVPIVSGIGHEQDISVLDHVARRAKTPTAAAGQIVDAVRASLRRVEDLGASIIDEAVSLLAAERLHRRDAARRLARAVRAFLDIERVELSRRREGLARATTRSIETARAGLSMAASALTPRATRAIALAAERIDGRARRLHLVDPRRVVERGYAIIRAGGGRVIVDPAQAPKGSRLTAELKSGSLNLRSE